MPGVGRKNEKYFINRSILQGIGQATARLLLEEGFYVYGVGRHFDVTFSHRISIQLKWI